MEQKNTKCFPELSNYLMTPFCLYYRAINCGNRRRNLYCYILTNQKIGEKYSRNRTCLSRHLTFNTSKTRRVVTRSKRVRNFKLYLSMKWWLIFPIGSYVSQKRAYSFKKCSELPKENATLSTNNLANAS